MATLCEELDCSAHSVHSVIADLRDRIGMPVEHAEGRGYYLDNRARIVVALHMRGSAHGCG